jgi:hypothetical protein
MKTNNGMILSKDGVNILDVRDISHVLLIQKKSPNSIKVREFLASLRLRPSRPNRPRSVTR